MEKNKVTVIGVDNFGLEVIGQLKCANIDVLEYIAINSNEEVNQPTINDENIVIYVGNCDESNTTKSLLKLVENISANKKYNVAYLSGNSIDETVIDSISLNNCSVVLTDKVVDSIVSFVESIYYPGMISIDLDDYKLFFNNYKKIYYQQLTSLDFENDLVDFMKEVSNKHDLSSIERIMYVISNNQNVSLRMLEEVSNKIKAYTTKDTISLFGTSDAKVYAGKYKFFMFYSCKK